jgi:hypothetical protein
LFFGVDVDWNNKVWMKSAKDVTVLWLMWLDSGFPTRRHGLVPLSAHVGFVLDKVAMGQVFFSEFFRFPLPVPFHRGSILIHVGDEK